MKNSDYIQSICTTYFGPERVPQMDISYERRMLGLKREEYWRKHYLVIYCHLFKLYL